MLQEQKAKRFDEAIKVARELSETKNEYYTPKELCEYIFPELKESEDEKIRKALIEIISNVWKKNWRNIPTEKVIAWLEKQGGNLVENGYTNNKDIIKYADNYSHAIWHKLMDNFKNIKDYHIGCNDVSDIVLNAIIDAYNWLEKQGEHNDSDVKDYNSIDPHFGKSIDKIETNVGKLG